jgi:hypothetical protein
MPIFRSVRKISLHRPRAVSRQENGTCAASLDCFFDPVDLMSGKIVQKDDVTLLQSWSKDLFDVGQEVGAVHWRAGPGNLDRTIGGISA